MQLKGASGNLWTPESNEGRRRGPSLRLEVGPSEALGDYAAWEQTERSRSECYDEEGSADEGSPGSFSGWSCPPHDRR